MLEQWQMYWARQIVCSLEFANMQMLVWFGKKVCFQCCGQADVCREHGCVWHVAFANCWAAINDIIGVILCLCLARGSWLGFSQQQVRLASCLNPLFLAILAISLSLWFLKRWVWCVMCFLHVFCVFLVVLFPWLQDLPKPSHGCFHLGPTFSCEIILVCGGVAEIKVVLPLIRDFSDVCWTCNWIKLPAHWF